MEFKLGLHRAGAFDVPTIQLEATRQGFTTFVLPGSGVVDSSSFFDAVRGSLPLDPPLLGSFSWDALSDSLWEGLYQHPSRRLAIIWPGAGEMEAQAPSDFELALNVLNDVANLLADKRATVGATKQLSIVVEVP